MLSEEEIKRELLALPKNEAERAYEIKSTNLATSWNTNIIRGDVFQAILKKGHLEGLTEEDARAAFGAFCVAVTHERRMRNPTAEEQLLEEWEDVYGERIFYRHLKALSLKNDFTYHKVDQWSKEKLCTMLIENRNDAKTLGKTNVGGIHNFADAVAVAYETMPEETKQLGREMGIDWLNCAIKESEKAIQSDPNFARYYCTKARLLAQKGQYQKAITYINIAIDKEDSQKMDYVVRIGEYFTHRQQFYVCLETDKIKRDTDGSIARYQEKLDKLEKQEQQMMTKNLEFLGLFAAIVSFTVGSVGISTSITNQPILNIAALIIILMGALLIVFSGLGMILHGYKGEYARRNYAVLIIGIFVIGMGVSLCIYK